MSSKQYTARKFNPISYANNDAFAKDLFIKFITELGHTVIKAEEDFDHDLITVKGGETFYFELEVALSNKFTSKEDYKYNRVSFLGRKERLHKKHRFHYVIISKETGYAVTADSKDIFKEEYKEEMTVNKPDRKGTDCFFRIPKEYCTFFKITD